MIPDITKFPRRFAPSVDSTMAWARRELESDPAGTGVVFQAGHQTAGRGRVPGRVWNDEADRAMLVTVALPSRLVPAREAGAMSLRTGFAVARTVDHFLGHDRARIKWPNDVLIEGRKVAGILIERTRSWLLVGVGINASQESFPPSLGARSTSLLLSGGAPTRPGDVLDRFLVELRHALRLKSWHIAVQGRLAWLGERCCFSSDALPGTARGTVAGIAEDGALTVTGLVLDDPTGEAPPDPWYCYSGEIVPLGWNE